MRVLCQWLMASREYEGADCSRASHQRREDTPSPFGFRCTGGSGWIAPGAAAGAREALAAATCTCMGINQPDSVASDGPVWIAGASGTPLMIGANSCRFAP